MARRFTGPDEFVYRVLAARRRARVPRGMQISQKSHTPERKCSQSRKCGHVGRPIGQPNARGELVWRCPRCGTPWPMKDVYQLSGQTHSGRGGRPPAAMLEAAELGYVVAGLERALPTEAQVYLAYIEREESRKTLAQVATLQGWGGRTWRPQDVRTANDRARAWLTRDLARRGMLDR